MLTLAAWAVYGHVITKFSRMGRFTFIIAMALSTRTHGPPLLLLHKTLSTLCYKKPLNSLSYDSYSVLDNQKA